MRLKLNLRCRPNSILSMNYAYALQAVIYKVLERADPTFSHWLHEHGYDATGKNFKLFTFDLLRGAFRNDYERQAIRFLDGQVEWRISFCVDETIEKFVMGLFQNQRLEVATPAGRIDFEVQGVEILSPPLFSNTMRFRAIMPICIAEKTETDKYAQYRAPDHPQFEKLFFSNLENKYKAALPTDTPLNDTQPTLRILSEPRKKGFSTIKRDMPRPTQTIGYLFDFEVHAPVEWLKVGCFAGFGGKNSSGFGYCEVL